MTIDEMEDRFAIHELIALYGHLIDEGEWHRLGELFTDDIVFDTSAFEHGEITEGLARLAADWATPGWPHPVAHHATNIVIRTLELDRAEVLSKGIGVGRKGRVGSVTYRDTLVKSAAGWRIKHRVAQLQSGR
ncbi:nuclear transport factor 2 family protein [Novosphingobium sp. ERN07]|uniref:nuclear transport factor 2 family protein n=1 Tax=Novosphingobium sp. ERN07 TaxID=2726187 RepID=UPI001980164F|nr:nuclear transport factor 2 family protein [Novosphingobium sp. ERN07]